MTRWQKLFVFGFALLLLGQVFFSTSPKIGSSFSSSPTGTKAIYLLLERLDEVDLERFKQPFSELPADPKDTLLIITTPETMGGETELAEWISKGGRVILFYPEAEEVKKLFTELGLNFKKGTDRKFQDEEGTFTVTFPTKDKSSSFNISLFQGTEMELPSGAELISGTEKQPQIFRYQKDLGELIFISDAKIIQNQFVDQADNVDFLLQLFSESQSILFDEFHHGFVAPAPLEKESQMEALIWFVSTLAAVLCLFVLGRSVRFGPPRRLVQLQIPPSTPFVIAIGNLFFSHRASSVLVNYVRSFRVRMERKSGVSQLLPVDRFVRELTVRQDLSKSVAAELEQAIEELIDVPDGILPTWDKHFQPLERVTNLNYQTHSSQAEGER